MWQSEWDKEKKGRHLYKLQQEIVGKKNSYINRQEEVWFYRMRIGHTALNSNLFIMNKHPSGNCEVCGVREDVEHVLLSCERFSRQREKLKRTVSAEKRVFSLETLLGEPRAGSITGSIVSFIKETQLANSCFVLIDLVILVLLYFIFIFYLIQFSLKIPNELHLSPVDGGNTRSLYTAI